MGLFAPNQFGAAGKQFNKIIVTIHVLNQSLGHLTLSLPRLNHSSCLGTIFRENTLMLGGHLDELLLIAMKSDISSLLSWTPHTHCIRF